MNFRFKVFRSWRSVTDRLASDLTGHFFLVNLGSSKFLASSNKITPVFTNCSWRESETEFQNPQLLPSHVRLSCLSCAHLIGLFLVHCEVTKGFDLSYLKRQLRRQESRVFDCQLQISESTNLLQMSIRFSCGFFKKLLSMFLVNGTRLLNDIWYWLWAILIFGISFALRTFFRARFNGSEYYLFQCDRPPSRKIWAAIPTLDSTTLRMLS